MLNNVDAQQAYINQRLKQIPDTQKGNVYTIKNGDSLWNIAKKIVNKPNPSNAEIHEEMLKIAKLNNIETIEKMNNLQVANKIFMPETTVTKAITKTQIKKESEERPNSEKSIINLKNKLLNDKTVFVEKAFPFSINTYHVYNRSKISEQSNITRQHILLSFNKKTDGSVNSVSFNDEFDKKDRIKYDYNIDDSGNILTNNSVRSQKKGKLTKDEMSELCAVLENISRKTR